MIYNFNSERQSAYAAGFIPDSRGDMDQADPPYRVDNPDSADVATAKRVALEMMSVNGADISVFIRTDNADFDDVWDEDNSPTYFAPASLRGFFQPKPTEYQLTKWGIDLDNSIEITFIRDILLNKFSSRMLRIGDILSIPYGSAADNRPKYYGIENTQETGMWRYQWMYMTVQAKLLQGDVILRPHTDNAHYYLDHHNDDGVGGRL